MSSEQVERLTPKQVLDKYRGEYKEPKTGWRDNRFMQYHPMKELYEALEVQCEELDRLRYGITAIIEGDKGDEPLETADQVVSLLEGLLAALEQ